MSDPASACRFYVEIGTMPQAVFTEVGPITVEVEVEEIVEGGNNDYVHRVPGRCKISTVTLKKGMTTSNDFVTWILQTAYGKILPMNMSVINYDLEGKPITRLDFIGVYPVRWTSPALRADDNGVAIESLELAHSGLLVKN